MLRDWLVGLKDVLANEVGDDRVEFAALVDRHVGRDAGKVANHLVVFTIGRGLVNDSGAIAVGNIVGNQNLPGVYGVELLGVGVVIE